ncbi:MAG: hypothetical protein MAG453_00688 [Calditrichaeota bacterium]|nr:hypothetical protein [Calditrichota bacterium]
MSGLNPINSLVRPPRRRGFTFIEVLTVIVIMAAVFVGFVITLYDVAEQMHISWQLRDAEEFGNWYVNKFIEKMRNGVEPVITHVTAPSEAEVTYMDPDQYYLPSISRVPERYEFEYDSERNLPAIRIDDQKFRYPYFPPEQQDERDTFIVPSETFKIYPSTQGELPESQVDTFRPYFLTIEFELVYRRQSSIPGVGVYEKVLPFTGSAYLYNEKWPVIEPPTEPEEEE